METNPASSTTASVSLKRNASSMDGDVVASAKRVRSDEPPPGHPHSASPIVQQPLPVTRTVEFALKGRSPSGSAPAAASNDPPPPAGPTSTDGDPDAAFRAAVLAKLAEASSGSSASPSTASTRTGPLPPIPDQPANITNKEEEEDEEEEEETDDPDAERSDGGWDDEDEWVPPAAAVPRNSSSIAPEANASGSGQSLISPPPTPAPARTDAAGSLPAPPPVVAEPTPDVPVAAPDDHAATTAAFSALVAEHEHAPADADVDDDWLEAVAPSNFALPDEPWATSPPTLPLDNAEELSPLTQPTHPASLGSSPPPISALPNHHTSHADTARWGSQHARSRSRSVDSYADSGDELNQGVEDVPVAPGFALRGSDGAKVQCALCGRWMGPEKTAEHVARVCGTIPKPDRKSERKPKRRSTRRSSTSTPKKPRVPRSPRKEKPIVLPAAKLAARRAELATDRWVARVEDDRGVLCGACGVWVDVGGAGLGAVQRWSGRTGHKSFCGEIVETVKREETEAKMRELTHAHEAPAPVPLEILADKRLRRIDGDQAQCNVCGVWTLFKNWDAHQGGKCEQIRARREAKAARREAKQAMRRAAKAGGAGAKGLEALSDLSSDSGDEFERGDGAKQPVRFPGMVYTGGPAASATASASGSGSSTTATGSGSAGTTTSASAGMAPSASAPATAAAVASASSTTRTNEGGSASASAVTTATAATPAMLSFAEFLARPRPFYDVATAAAAASAAAVSTSSPSISSSSAHLFRPFRPSPVNAKEKAGSASAGGPAPTSAPGWTGPVPAFPWKPWVGDPRLAFGRGTIPADNAQKMYQAQPGMRIEPQGHVPAPAPKGKANAPASAPAATASSSASASASTSAKLSGPASASASTGPASTSNGQTAAPVTGKRAAGPSTESPAAKKAKVAAASEAGPSKKKVLPLASILAEANARAEAAATAGPATPRAAKPAAPRPAVVPPSTANKAAASHFETRAAATPAAPRLQLAWKTTRPSLPYGPGKNKRATVFSKAAKGRAASPSSSSTSSAGSKSEKESKEWCNAPFPYVRKGPPSRAMEVHGTYQLCGREVSVSSVHYRTTRFEDLPTDPDELLRLERQVILYYDADVAQVAKKNAIRCKGCNEWVLLPRSGVPTNKWYGNTGHKACCEKNVERRKAAERQEAMEGIPEVRFEEPFRIRRIKGDKVQCAGCGKPVSAAMWARHLDERCPFYTLPSTAPKYESNGSDSEGADSWASAPAKSKGKQVPLGVTIAKRRAQLLEDAAVREIGKDKLLCDSCGKWVKIAKHLYAEYKWYGPQGHRDRCIAQHPNWKPRADKDEPPLSPATSVPVTPAKPGSSTLVATSKSSLIARRPPTKPTAVPPSSPASVIVIPDTSSDHEINEDDDEYNPDDDGSGAESESSEDPELDV